MNKQDFLVDRTDLTSVRTANTEQLTPAQGQAVLNIERFALTANNITYGVAGDMIGYWKFFPAPDPWGRIPVWGIATVSESNDSGLEPGQRFYGYFPMSSQLLVTPGKISARGFTDASKHRADLPVVYNQYTLVSEDNGFAPALENHMMVYRPLFTTSFVLDDYFRDNDDFGARAVVLGSASSKTAFGMAFMLHRSKRVKVIGLTSNTNLEFVKSLGLYDEIYTYDDVEAMDNTAATAYVDMSGNRSVLVRVHKHLGENLVASCGVGITHWETRDNAPLEDLPGAKPTMFFAPSQIVKRTEEWGSAQLQAKIGEATAAFFAEVDRWVGIEDHDFSSVEETYRMVLNGAPADRGVVIVLENV
jgi:hypothetical protein